MNVHQLSRDQLIELKQTILCNRDRQPSWLDLATADEIITDDEVYEEFSGTSFTPADSFCS